VKLFGLLEVNPWQQKETLLQKQVQIRSLILPVLVPTKKKIKGSAKCWRRFTGLSGSSPERIGDSSSNPEQDSFR
jgi:hypothetical protein